jgi:hypothetical protein
MLVKIKSGYVRVGEWLESPGEGVIRAALQCRRDCECPLGCRTGGAQHRWPRQTSRVSQERAQGQVTTNTARVADIARCGSKTLQNTATTSASVSVTKENQEATRVATATVRGFSAPASCSNSMISASVDCAADFALRISDATDIRCRRWTSSKYEPCPRADVRTTGA